MNKQQQPLLVFPEKFPIKVFGLDGGDFAAAVETIIGNHVDDHHVLQWQSNPSRKGKYVAITVTIMAQSRAQLDNIYMALTACEHVKMAL